MNRERRVEIRQEAERIEHKASALRRMRDLEARDFDRQPAHAKATKAAEFTATIEAFNVSVRCSPCSEACGVR